MFLAVLTHAASKLHWSPTSQHSVCTADAVTPYNTSAQITLMYAAFLLNIESLLSLYKQ